MTVFYQALDAFDFNTEFGNDGTVRRFIQIGAIDSRRFTVLLRFADTLFGFDDDHTFFFTAFIGGGFWFFRRFFRHFGYAFSYLHAGDASIIRGFGYFTRYDGLGLVLK